MSGGSGVSRGIRTRVLRVLCSAALLAATPFQIASSGGRVTLGAGDAQLRITDTGYWKLDSLNPVPLPAAGLLLISGLAGLFGVERSGKLGRAVFTPAQ